MEKAALLTWLAMQCGKMCTGVDPVDAEYAKIKTEQAGDVRFGDNYCPLVCERPSHNAGGVEDLIEE